MGRTRILQLAVVLVTIVLSVLLFLAPRTPSTFNSDEERVRHVIYLVQTGQAGPPMQAIILLREVAEQQPDNIELQLQLGHFSMQTNQFNKAIERYEIVKHLDVADTTEADNYLASAKVSLALNYFEQGDSIMKGAEILADVLKEYPENPEVNFYMGQFLLSLEEYHEALNYFGIVKDYDTEENFSQVLFYMAEIHAVLNEYEMAMFYMEMFRNKVLDDPDMVAGIDDMLEEYKTHLN